MTKQPRKKSIIQVVIPEPLHYLGFWLIRQNVKGSPTRIAQTLPVLVHMASKSYGIQVMAPGFRDWLSYDDALLALLEKTEPCTFNNKEIYSFLQETLDFCLPVFGDTLLFCDAQNARGIWHWLGNEHITQALPKDLERFSQLRIVRLRTGDHEIPEWYAQSEKDAYGFSQGIFTIGNSGHLFAGVQQKPPTAVLSKEISKVLSQTKLDKKTQTDKTYNPRPDIAAWNAGIGEIAVACMNPDDAFMCAVVTYELRHHFASHFGSPTKLPIPLHLADLLEEYVLPLNKSTRGSEPGDEDE